VIWPFQRFKGMIRPNMALSFDDSRRIADRKSVAMVGYLRARRSVHDPLAPEWQRQFDLQALKASRSAHLRRMKALHLVKTIRPLA
jgi:hypothetical protein